MAVELPLALLDVFQVLGVECNPRRELEVDSG